MERMVLVHENHLATAVIDAHRHELAALIACSLLTELTLPAIEAAGFQLSFMTELFDSLTTFQKHPVEIIEVFDCPHTIRRFCGQS